MAERKYIQLYYDFVEQTKQLTDAEFGALIRALLRYARGEDPAPHLVSPNVSLLFDVYSSGIDREKERLSDISAVAQAMANKRWQKAHAREQDAHENEAMRNANNNYNNNQ